MPHVEDDNQLSALNIIFKDDSKIFKTIELSITSLVLCKNIKNQRKRQRLSIRLDRLIFSVLPILIEDLPSEEASLWRRQNLLSAEKHDSRTTKNTRCSGRQTLEAHS
jgi:hypothetical protein